MRRPACSTTDKAVGAAVLAFLATIAGALLDGSFALVATLGVAVGTGLAAGLAVYRIPYYPSERRRLRRMRRGRRPPGAP